MESNCKPDVQDNQNNLLPDSETSETEDQNSPPIEQLTKRKKKSVRFLLSRFCKKCIRQVKRTLRFIQYCFIRRTTLIVPNRIAFMSFSNEYACNPKYIAEALLKSGENYELIWITSKPKSRFPWPYDIKVVKFGTTEAMRAASSAKIWIDNGILFSKNFSLKRGQRHIQTMHGSLGIKRLDQSIASRRKQGRSGRVTIRREEKNTDFVLTNSPFEEECFRTVFWHDTPMERLGHARMDILFNTDTAFKEELKRNVYERYGIPRNKKIVLYGPTFRPDLSDEPLDIDFDSFVQALNKRFGGEHAVLLRLHVRNMKNKKLMNRLLMSSSVYNATDYPDIQELMLLTDVAVTDYSSWIFDYVVTGRPGLIYAKDEEQYNNLVGLYYLLEDTPFPVCHSNDELLKAVSDFDMSKYRDRVKAFLDEKEPVDDGHACERIVAKINEMIRT